MNIDEPHIKSSSDNNLTLWVTELSKVSLFPVIYITLIYTLFSILMYILFHNLSPTISESTQHYIYICMEILIAVCICWLIMRLINKSHQLIRVYLIDNGYILTEHFIYFLINFSKYILLLSFTIVVIGLLPIPAQFTLLTEKLISILIISIISIILLKLVNLIERFIITYYKLDDSTNLAAQSARTQIILLKRIIIGVLIIISFAIILMQFSNVRELGASILASAGLATIIAGLAAQRLLSILLMGLQIALNQPIKINDYLIVENEFGQVEEITLNYVVIKIWDFRRLIIPINYFIEKPFQNLSRRSEQSSRYCFYLHRLFITHFSSKRKITSDR